ncbi:efflux transporter outer membrane subunit [Vogesella indigofera]|uniref:efflux transporter outer membrane subunit n=1 Tax=Vogesella indigofera TaxID=45465 RepID=UPI00234EA81B|nr:efflux transporter outer membrane subunit [Vogesella indigofera]MDC7706157.1 efflux transporter outer membrane subunit [Vogesella indigofera]
MMLKQALLPMVVAAALSACAVGPDYQRPQLDMPQAAANVAPVANDWWRSFEDPVLDAMIDESLRYNRDLVQAAARVEEAAAAAGVARAGLLPQVSASAGSGRSQTSTYSSGGGALLDSRQAGLTASWELDLWGKLRREREAALADVSASEHSLAALRLSLGSQVAKSYFQLASYDAQLASARATLQSREQSLQLRQKRFNGGMTSELELRQAEAEAASARATVPQLAQAVTQTEHALAVLLGRSPRDIAANLGRGKALSALAEPEQIPSGLPSDLLLRRADVAAAEASLIAANARIGVARAAYFPSISLSAGIGSASTALVDLFSGPAQTWNFAANLTAPIFNAGRIAAGVDAANARQKQALAVYEKTVQQAFADTLDAMSAVSTTRATEQAQLQQLASLREALRLARLRYDNGYSSYLDVLDAERGVFQVEQALSSARLARLSAVVSLYAALGGGWQAG